MFTIHKTEYEPWQISQSKCRDNPVFPHCEISKDLNTVYLYNYYQEGSNTGHLVTPLYLHYYYNASSHKMGKWGFQNVNNRKKYFKSDQLIEEYSSSNLPGIVRTVIKFRKE